MIFLIAVSISFNCCHYSWRNQHGWIADILQCRNDTKRKFESCELFYSWEKRPVNTISFSMLLVAVQPKICDQIVAAGMIYCWVEKQILNDLAERQTSRIHPEPHCLNESNEKAWQNREREVHSLNSCWLWTDTILSVSWRYNMVLMRLCKLSKCNISEWLIEVDLICHAISKMSISKTCLMSNSACEQT